MKRVITQMQTIKILPLKKLKEVLRKFSTNIKKEISLNHTKSIR
jgi:hypothetical protein